MALTADQPLDKRWEYTTGLAAALRDAGQLADARAFLRQTLATEAWSDAQHVHMIAQLIGILVRLLRVRTRSGQNVSNMSQKYSPPA